MSLFAPAPTLVLGLGLRDNGGWIAQTQILEALPFMTSDYEEHGKRSDLPLSSLSRLIKRSKAGEHDAMEEIYEHYKGSLFNLAYRYTYNRQDAEDLLQDIFVKVFTHIREVQKVETFGAWVYRIALNACYSYLRSTKSRERRTVRLSEVEGRMDEAVGHDHNHSLEKPLDEAIQQLPEKLKEVFLLHDVQGYKHEEIARMLGLAVGTSKSQLFKARMRIREFLKSKGVL